MVVAEPNLSHRCREDLAKLLEENRRLHESEAGQRILGQSDAYKRALILELIHQLGAEQVDVRNNFMIVVDLIRELLRRRLAFEKEELLVLIEWTATSHPFLVFGAGGLIRQIEYYLGAHPMTPKVAKAIQALAAWFERSNYEKELRRYIIRLREWAPLDDQPEAMIPLTPGDVWSDQVVTDIQQMSSDQRILWPALLTFLQKTTGSSPSTKWLLQARALVQPIGYPSLRSLLLAWFPLVDKPRTVPIVQRNAWAPDSNLMLIHANTDILRGLVWLCAEREDEELARALTALAISTYRKIPGIGPRCVRVGNACIWALGNMPGRAGIYQLALLQFKVKFGTAQKAIEKALTVAAQRESLSRDEIEEISTPTYGLSEVGLRREEIGEFIAELQVTGTSSTELRWLRSDGKVQKSVPKAVKSNFAEELKELQQAAKDIKQMLPVQSNRLDSLYLLRKEWKFEQWQARYLNHPLVGILARRLIWRFQTAADVENAIWCGDGFVDCSGQPVTVTQNTIVRLWHPLDAPVEQVLAWRTWLEEHHVQQPFKQAHREIYLLTDAERRTATYSNRYAAHILKQHQFNALCGARSWHNKLRLMVDDTYPPAYKELSAWGLRAEYWVEGIGNEYGEDTNEAGVYLRLVTDQVRFYAINTPQNHAHAAGGGYGGQHFGYDEPHPPLAMEQVPPLVFSEIMRDVDLFVGVASLGNDPNWHDGGPHGHYRTYWMDYAFGELSESAQTRHAVLEKLLPRLKIASRCTLADRFLRVRGDLRTYKIHLGSGNILMEPDDQYLCIVPGQGMAGSGAQLFLPFEGDRMFAIILSKAFLLADDTRISDPTILRQLKR